MFVHHFKAWGALWVGFSLDENALSFLETRLRCGLEQLWPSGQDEILSVLSARTKGPDSLSTPQPKEQGSNVPSATSLCWISNGSVGQCFIFHFACLSFLNFSLSLNQGRPGHTSATWTQFSTVERTHQVVLLSLRGWYDGTFYLLGASEASCASINELQRDVTDRNTQWAHLFDWRLSQALTALCFHSLTPELFLLLMAQ